MLTYRARTTSSDVNCDMAIAMLSHQTSILNRYK
jgi:hypothetical protein